MPECELFSLLQLSNPPMSSHNFTNGTFYVDFAVLLAGDWDVGYLKISTHDLICLLVSLIENLLLVRGTGRPSLPSNIVLDLTTLKLSSGNSKRDVRPEGSAMYFFR